jgi:hypothetical protein
VAGAAAFARGRLGALVADLCRPGRAGAGRCALSERDLETLAAEQDSHADAGWVWFEAALTALFRRLLYSPVPTPLPLPGEPGPLVGGSTLVPMRLVRAALALAGGYGTAAGSAGLRADGSPVDPLVPMGGVATGAEVLRFLARHGVAPTAWEWRHGSGGTQPFEAHLALDGLVVDGPEDPRLVNTDSFPDTEYFFAGDHEGCSCACGPIFGAGAVLDEAA